VTCADTMKVAYGLPLCGLTSLSGLASGNPGLISPRLYVDLLEHDDSGAMPQGAGDDWYAGVVDEACGRPAVRVVRFGTADRWYFRLHYRDDTKYVVDAQGTHIWGAWPETVTTEDALTYLVGPVLGFALRLRGVTALHASAVAVDGRCVILVGDAGAGKSTAAAAFAVLGYPILTEDIAALEDGGDRFRVQPGYPRVNLWPASAALLFGSAETLPRICPRHPTWDKRYLDLTQDGYRFQAEPLPLGAVYFLSGRRDDVVAPYAEPVAAPEALLTLVAHTYTNYLLDKSLRAREFEVLSRLVRHVPVRRVVPHAAPTRIWELCDAILADFASHSTAPAAHRV
jgi:hypothetical protein